MARQISQGAKNAFSIIAIISVYLGLFNLLPLPALDGGRLAFLGWEAISGGASISASRRRCTWWAWWCCSPSWST